MRSVSLPDLWMGLELARPSFSQLELVECSMADLDHLVFLDNLEATQNPNVKGSRNQSRFEMIA